MIAVIPVRFLLNTRVKREMNSKMNDRLLFKASKNLFCGSCNLQFSIKDITLKGSRNPVLLHCGHSICEYCVHQKLKAGKISCQLCGTVSFLQSTEQTSEWFSPSIYTLGSLVALQNSRHGKDKSLRAFLTDGDGNFSYTVKDETKLNMKSDSNSSSCEECFSTAVWCCENCKSNFCEICWARIHGSARSLMKHCKAAISNVESKRMGWKKCPVHDFQDLEFYCKGCSTVICSHCVILQHQGEGHCPITLREKNMEIINNMKTAAEEAEKIAKRMKHTLEKIKVTQSTEAVDALFPDLERQISRNFSQMHGILQLEEERLLKKLQENLNQRENCIQALRMQLENQIEVVESILREYDTIVNKPQKCDLSDFYRQLEEVQNLPCYLVSQNLPTADAKVMFDDGLIKLLKSYCTIDLPSSAVFELRSSSSLPEGYAVEPLDLSDSEQNASKVEMESDFDTFSNSSRDFWKRDVDSLSPKGSVVFQEKKSYSVRVTYIKNPGEFYITLNSQRSKQMALEKNASHFANCSSAIPKNVSKDEVYLVKYKVDKKWYRARVVEVFASKKTEDEECILVYYLDYGNSETVPLSRLRVMPPEMLGPPLAVKCKLFDCVPKGGEWCLESSKTMEKILNNCNATMFVMKVHRHCLEVDLSVIYPDGQIGRDIVSIRDALIFLEFSNFVHGSKVPRAATPLKYLHQSLPSVGETFDVVITHINSPSDFYVQKAKQDASFLYKITVDLQKCYSGNLEKGIIYNPAIGMPCAALYPADQKWYRAKIVDVPGKKMVTVLYIDYGNKETIPWIQIRKLKENFFRCPPLALTCALAGIYPVDDSWSEQARSYMEGCLMMKGCRVHVSGKPKSKQRLKVLLYKRANTIEVCVNSLFVDLGYAIKSNVNYLWKLKDGEDEGSFSENSSFKSAKLCRKQPEDENRFTLNGENYMPRKSKVFKDRGKTKLSAKKLRELHESEKKKCNETSSSEETENEIDEIDKVFKVKVEILSAESPSSIYVTFPALMEEFKHLQAKLNEFYENSSPSDVDWVTGSVCAAFDSSKNCWCRASVLSVLSGDQVKVFLKDVVRVSIVPVSALRELDPSFSKYPSCAVKCHLADIRPPGEQWPSISSEYLLSELENFNEIYMTKKGQIHDMSLPVELWVRKIVPGGALEPTAKEWVTLNRLLVSQGLAVPMKQSALSNSVPSNDEEYSDDVKESETAVADTLSKKSNEDMEITSDAFIPSLSLHWLPPEPPKNSCFVGVPTYVDSNAVMYIYDVEQDEEKLKTISKTLLNMYGNSKPNSEDHFWSPGQLCIAKYHADNSWYRGQIIKVNEDMTYEVMFVDYGNVETCGVSDLRKGIKMHDIPILSRKFQFQGIAPVSNDGKWPIGVIDLLHSLIVDKHCQVTIFKPSLDPSGPHFVSMKLIEGDIEIGDFLVNQGLALLTCLMTDSLDSSGSEFTLPYKDYLTASAKNEGDLRNYIPLNIPDDCDGFLIEVTAIKSETEFFANIVNHESTASDLRKVLNEFDNLQKKLSDECHLQPLLEKLEEGEPCCCVHLRNNRWCRGEIESLIPKDNSVCVFYVDLGEKEFLNKDLLHECRSEWLSLPKMAVKFRLSNISKRQNVSKSVYMKALTVCLNQSSLFAEIISKHEESLEVRLLTEKNGSLVYQEMIDKQLMTFIG